MRIESHYTDTYREEVLKPLAESVKKGSCRTIVALKGAGLGPLTRFLHYHPVVSKKYFENDDSYQLLFLNIEELVNIEQKTFLKEFLRELKDHLIERELAEQEQIQNEYLAGIASEDEQEILHKIKALLEIATNYNLKIIFLFQEFDQLIETNSPILNTLFNLYFNYRPNLVFVYGIRTLPERIRTAAETKFDYTFHNSLILKPFGFQEFVDHYVIHIKERGLKINEEHLKVFYKYTGGMPSYNRFVQAVFDFKNLDNLEERLRKMLEDPNLLIVTRQLLAPLKASEIKTLKSVSGGEKNLSATDLKILKDFGLVTEDTKIFAEILESDLKRIEAAPKLEVDQKSKKIFVDKSEISVYLSPIEFKFLQYLSEHKGEVCDRENIIEFAWGGNPSGISDEAVDQLVSRLRSKLTNKTGSNELIKTVRGRGFILE